MGNPFTSATVSSYNSNPPADDGSQVVANRVQWSTQKTKLTDPIKTALESDISNTNTAFAKVVGGAGVTATATDYTVSASDQGKLIKVTASATITTPDATVVGAPFVFNLVNLHTSTITLDGSGSQTIDGVASFTIPAGNGLTLYTDGTNWFTVGQNFTKSFPPPSAFKNLSIKVASNTTVTVAADFVVTTNGSAYQTTAVSSTINMGTTGIDALDAGTIAISTWYAIWVIAKADGTTKCLASTSSSSPTMPTDYTYKARVGWVGTIAGSATLYGTWQLGRRAQYVVGLAQTAAPPVIASGVVGTYSASSPTLSSATVTGNGYVAPTTASELFITVSNGYKGGTAASVIVAPSAAYSGTNNGPTGSDGTVPPVWLPNTIGPQTAASILLESSAIYAASDNTGGAILCTGWVDNI